MLNSGNALGHVKVKKTRGIVQEVFHESSPSGTEIWEERMNDL